MLETLGGAAEAATNSADWVSICPAIRSATQSDVSPAAAGQTGPLEVKQALLLVIGMGQTLACLELYLVAEHTCSGQSPAKGQAVLMRMTMGENSIESHGHPCGHGRASCCSHFVPFVL